MPYYETPEELSEELADMVGVYGGHDENEKKPCRICWTGDMADRIRKSVGNQNRLKASAGPNNCPRCGQFFDSMGDRCEGCAADDAGIPKR